MWFWIFEVIRIGVKKLGHYPKKFLFQRPDPERHYRCRYLKNKNHISLNKTPELAPIGAAMWVDKSY